MKWQKLRDQFFLVLWAHQSFWVLLTWYPGVNLFLQKVDCLWCYGHVPSFRESFKLVFEQFLKHSSSFPLERRRKKNKRLKIHRIQNRSSKFREPTEYIIYNGTTNNHMSVRVTTMETLCDRHIKLIPNYDYRFYREKTIYFITIQISTMVKKEMDTWSYY